MEDHSTTEGNDKTDLTLTGLLIEGLEQVVQWDRNIVLVTGKHGPS